MRHITVCNYGDFLGVRSERLIIKSKNGEVYETPLSRVRSIRVMKAGVSLSSTLIEACASRGIRLFFCDWTKTCISALTPTNQHAVVNVRRAQFKCIESPACRRIACEMILSKIRNQRAVLLYFDKYLRGVSKEKSRLLRGVAESLEEVALRIQVSLDESESEDWRGGLLAKEGAAAKNYWRVLSSCLLLPSSFTGRTGRGATEITNAALNYAYAVLYSYCFAALDNAGLELYAGFLHSNRPGKASLVLDFMEEYRPWIVDRNIIKHRKTLKTMPFLTQEIKRQIISSIDQTLLAKQLWRGKRLRVENIMQRQAYRLCGAMRNDKSYKGIRFKW